MNPLSGVKFALEDTQGNTLRELISDEDGVVRVTDLAPGSYVIRETEALEGFLRTEETIRLTVDESYVVPNEMARLVNYTGIQTGFAITMTPVMWAGVAMVAVAGVLAVCYGKSGKKGRVKKRRR
ncbi:MAG: prealbumin-like fold domain-containing protein [Eubacteriales bacterium]|nr:prealbumin-like fold domain-containing protein [Eubacteriales bacterium]